MGKITLDAFLDYRFLSGVRLSPSERWAAFLSHTADLARNGYESSLWVCDLEHGGEIRLGSRGNIQDYLWMDDRALLFIENSGKYESVLRMLALSGEEAELARLPWAVSLAGRLMDGRLVLITEEDPARMTRLMGKTGLEREWEIKELARQDEHFSILDEYPFWRNGKGFISKVRRRLWLFNLDNGDFVPITPETMRVEGLAVSEDRRQIAYFGNDFQIVQPDTVQVCLYDAATGVTQTLLDEGTLRVSRIALSKDGRIWLAGKEMRNDVPAEPCERLYCMEAGKAPVQVGDDEWSFGNVVGSDCRYGAADDFLARDGALWFIATMGENSHIFRAEKGGAPCQVTTGPGSVDCLDAGAGRLVAVAMRRTRLQELYLWEPANGFTTLTAQNAALCDALDIVIPRELRFVNRYGVEVQGFILEPVDKVEGRQYPAILDIHGGPHTVYGSVFYHEMQYWANSGYYVLYCNPTGSAGRGNTFGDIRGAWGGKDYEDIMSFVDKALEAYPEIDEGRVGVTGGSYGGYMTNWIIGHTHRFRAAATQRSISNLLSQEGTSDCGMRFRRQHFISDYRGDLEEKLWDMSPLKYIDTAVTPTLIIHAEEDKRCWYAEGLQLFTALRQNDVEARMILFREENHELSRSGKPRNRIKRLEEITAWMDRYLK